MPTIQAWQHIYSNVEAEQSPQGRGGFQTLFYTLTGLTGVEVTELESRLLYFPSGVEPAKRLFFTIASGKGVVAQIVSLPDPDQFGRKGRYLAHSLVFSPADLAQFQADPFCLFRGFTFITSVAGALAQGDFQTGDMGPVSLDLPATPTPGLEAARLWPASELKKLALLALRVDEQARRRQAVTFTGEPAQIENALEAAFFAAPISMRPRCTFDTYFYRCNLVATYFWAVGLPEPPVSLKFAWVDGALRRVQAEISDQPQTAYERWVLAAIDANRLDEIAHQRDRAFAIAAWLDQQAYEPALLETASPELITTVFKVNAGPVQALLRRRLAEQLPAALVERVAGHLYNQTTEVALYRLLQQEFELTVLLETLYEALAAQNFAEPSRQEVKALGELLQTADHPLLRLFQAYWSSPAKQFPKELERLNDLAYRQFAEIALRLNLVEPFSLLRPGRADDFLDLYLASGLDDLIALTGALIEVEGTACLARLTGYVAQLENGQLRQLARLIERRADIPEPFRQAVEQAVAALPPEKGLKGLLRAVWPRRSERG